MRVLVVARASAVCYNNATFLGELRRCS